MPRGKSHRYHKTKQLLMQSIRSGKWKPGDKFLTNRELSGEYDISYVTAQTLMKELCGEGHLERHSTNGTFIPGTPSRYESVQLIFHRQAAVHGSYGEFLLNGLTTLLDQASIPWTMTYTEEWRACPSEQYPVLWERNCQGISANLGEMRSFGLLLNQMPPHGLSGVYLDSVCVNAYSAGVIAGQTLKKEVAGSKTAILHEPTWHMDETFECVRGIQSIWPGIPIIRIDPAAISRKKVLKQTLAAASDGMFCIAQKIAADLKAQCCEMGLDIPKMVVFTYPPLIKGLNIPAVTIPLDDILEAAVHIIRKRFAGDSSAASHISLTPRFYSPE